MRFSEILGQTLRDAPAGAELPGYALLVRAALVRDAGAGRFAWLPLGARTLARLASLMTRAACPLNAQLVALPGTGEDARSVTADLLRRDLRSYRQLPLTVYDVLERAATAPRPRGGPLAAAAERAWQIVAAHQDTDGLSALAASFAGALRRLWLACGLVVVPARLAEGSAWLWPHPAGDQDLARCPVCAYAAERSAASSAVPETEDEPMQPPEEVATPGADTIASLAAFLGIPERKTAKALFYTLGRQVIVVLIRGDRAVDEAKVARALGTFDYAVSIESELEAVGAVGGYGSPVGLRGARILADRTVAAARNLVGGANRAGFHLLNLNLGRDYQADQVLDLAQVEAGDPCPECGEPLALERAFSLAEWRPFQSAPPVTYLDATGRGQEVHLAEGWVGLGRVVAAVAEAHHDDQGLIWPAAVAPLDVHLVALNLNQADVAAQMEALVRALEARELAVLVDDRDERPGVKFNDADLIGLPLRVTVSRRALDQGGFEVKWRHRPDRQLLDEATLLEDVEAWQATRAVVAG